MAPTAVRPRHGGPQLLGLYVHGRCMRSLGQPPPPTRPLKGPQPWMDRPWRNPQVRVFAATVVMSHRAVGGWAEPLNGPIGNGIVQPATASPICELDDISTVYARDLLHKPEVQAESPVARPPSAILNWGALNCVSLQIDHTLTHRDGSQEQGQVTVSTAHPQAIAGRARGTSAEFEAEGGRRYRKHRCRCIIHASTTGNRRQAGLAAVGRRAARRHRLQQCVGYAVRRG